MVEQLADEPVHPRQFGQPLGRVVGTLGRGQALHGEQLHIALDHAERIADLVRQARGQPAHRGELLGPDHFLLVGVQLPVLLGQLTHGRGEALAVRLDARHHGLDGPGQPAERIGRGRGPDRVQPLAAVVFGRLDHAVDGPHVRLEQAEEHHHGQHQRVNQQVDENDPLLAPHRLQHPGERHGRADGCGPVVGSEDGHGHREIPGREQAGGGEGRGLDLGRAGSGRGLDQGTQGLGAGWIGGVGMEGVGAQETAARLVGEPLAEHGGRIGRPRRGRGRTRIQQPAQQARLAHLRIADPERQDHQVGQQGGRRT